MVDVGAHFGIELAMFAGLGWQVYAFEPDPKNRRQLVTSFGNHPRVAIDARAVSDVAGQEIAFYTSDVSTRISGLLALPASHTDTQQVVPKTIADSVEVPEQARNSSTTTHFGRLYFFLHAASLCDVQSQEAGLGKWCVRTGGSK